METVSSSKIREITKNFAPADNPSRMLIAIVVISIVLGLITGYILANKNKGIAMTSAGVAIQTAKNAQTDTQTFKDFAEGVIKAKVQTGKGIDYSEGTHILVREGAVPVALTSSVVDLSKYEGKKVKVYGETQKALKEGWLMDVGKVEQIN